MTSQDFTFPPPPPPPPATNYSFAQPAPAPYAISYGGRGRGNFGTANRGQWRGNGYNSRGGTSRGNSRGRGQGYVPQQQNNGYGGIARGGYGNVPNPNTYGPYNLAVPQSPYGEQRSQQYQSSTPSLSNINQQKRPYSTAFPRPQTATHFSQTAPNVPSFGHPLPALPSAPTSLPPKPTKRKHPRKHNQLGLTPAQEEHETSSASASEADEESQLVARSANAGLQISYKGQTSNLKSAADITAWIAERKKRFPTKERTEARVNEAADRKIKFDEAKKARDEAMRAKWAERQETRTANDSRTDGATKARLNAEKLKKKALKAEKVALKAEAKLSKKQSIAIKHHPPKPSVPSITQESFAEPNDDSELKDTISSDIDLSDVSSYISSSEDETTSSGSSASDSDIEASISDASTTSSTPELASSKLHPDHPPRVPPPPRNGPQQVIKKSPKPCHRFAATGQCPKGDRCRYSHDSDPKTSKKRERNERGGDGVGSDQHGKGGRKGLYKVLMEKQEDEDRKHVLRSILYLGEKGLLD